MKIAVVTQIYLSLPFWDITAFKLNQQMAPQQLPIWGKAGDFKLIIE